MNGSFAQLHYTAFQRCIWELRLVLQEAGWCAAGHRVADHAGLTGMSLASSCENSETLGRVRQEAGLHIVQG